jgi:acetoin utilization deacetylase AcuC-like enzyme/formylglycine-generating enzyme required for sulfatase activity
MTSRTIKLTAIVPFLLTLSLIAACRRVTDNSVKPQTVKTKSGLEMVVIPGGSFEMGGNKGAPDESPAHRVSIESFWMDRYEVPQNQFGKFQMPDPSHFKDPENPLEQINWTDAAIFCNERSLDEGLEPCYDEETWDCNFEANGYRLPTEAEWEYACRAGTTTKYSFGNNARRLKEHAWFAENSSGKTHRVGLKKPNPWGLYDMNGNVAEWCNDFYSGSYYGRAPEKNPRGPTKGKERVLRGGAWNSTADSCRSSYRSSDPSINDTCLASDAIGFRCVRRAPGNPSVEPNKQPEDPAPGISKTGFLYDEIYLEHKTTPGHPESPARLVKIVERLKTTGLYARMVPLTPRPVPIEWLTTVHASEYVQRAARSCEESAGYLDSGDVPISSKSFESALMAAGGVLCAVDAVMEGKVTNAFCAIRPPGHHATKNRAMGFCIFNNVAVGTRYVQREYGLQRILIVDWDVHHGNGTQAMFYEDPNVLYFSVHQYPFYPGTGSRTEKGKGKGLNYNINVPLPPGSKDEHYLRAFEQELRPAALAFDPDFVFVSAGFDAHQDDLLGGMKVTTEGFREMTRITRAIAEECCRGRLVSVLEGGYELNGLADSVEAHIRALMM